MKQLGSIVRSIWTRSYRGRLVVCFMVVHACGMLTGCGVSMFNPVDVGGSASLRSDFGELGTPDVFVLDWTGGSSMLYADVELASVDFEAFATPDGGTLADDSAVARLIRRPPRPGPGCGAGAGAAWEAPAPGDEGRRLRASGRQPR